jgi:predicted DNA-binding transcriptional regulator AlpA
MRNNLGTNKPKALLNATELCTYLSIGISTAYKLLNTAGFPTVKIGIRKYANIELLDKWLLNEAERGTKGHGKQQKI